MTHPSVVWFTICIVVVSAEASIYDDDYDTYTKTYDYKNSGNIQNTFYCFTDSILVVMLFD